MVRNHAQQRVVVETIALDDPLPFKPGDADEPDQTPHWVWVLTTADGAGEGIDIRAASLPMNGEYCGRRNARAEPTPTVPGEPAPLPQPEEILNPDAVARVLGIPRKTVTALCADGRLEGAFKAGRQWRVPGRAVRKLAGFDAAAPIGQRRR